MELIEKTSIIYDPEISSEGGQTKIITKDGRSFEKRVDNPHGFYDDPLTDQELEYKFKYMAAKHMNQKQIQRIFDIVWKLEDLKQISDLTSLMVW